MGKRYRKGRRTEGRRKGTKREKGRSEGGEKGRSIAHR